MKFYQKDLLCTQEWSQEELITVLELAEEMQKKRFSSEYNQLLKDKTFMMFFYNPSVRTRQSFEAAATELGGHAQFLEPKAMRLKTEKTAGETIEDVAKVLSRYAVGVGIRILEDKITKYREGDKLLREFAQHCDVPVINMADDRFHPCQGLADMMGLRKHLGKDLKGKKILVTWAKGALARSWCSVQEALLIASRMGMEVVLAHPEGYGLDPEVIKETEKNCGEKGASFRITHNPEEAYEKVEAVYSRNWMSPQAYKSGELDKAGEIQKAMEPRFSQWICDKEKMAKTNNALFMHPMPVDRGNEVVDEIASGPRSIIYEVAENRLHVQKAIMALTMNKKFAEQFEKS